MPAIRVTTNAPIVAQTFRRYAELNKRNVSELIVDQSRKLATELYNQTAAVAPNEAQIVSDVQKLGWKIPAYFKDGRLARGHPDDWAANAVASLPKQRGRKSKARQAAESALRAAKPTLQQMQAFVIARRLRACLYVATGWLGAVSDLGGSLKESSGKVESKRGRAEIETGAEYSRVTIINDTPGIVEVNDKHNVVNKAILARLADMRVYIARKLREAGSQAFRKAA